MKRRTFAQIEAAAIDLERERVLAFIGRHIGGVQALVGAGKVDADSASLLTTRLETFAEQIGQGLHEITGANDGEQA